MSRFEVPGDDDDYAIDEDGAVYTMDGTCIGTYTEFSNQVQGKKQSPKKRKTKASLGQDMSVQIFAKDIQLLKSVKLPVNRIVILAAALLTIYQLEDVPDFS